jgi:signal transduction histidine kinase
VVHLATLLLVGTGSMVLLLTLVGSALVLLAAPLLDRVADVPISLGPWTIDTTGQSWLAFALGVPAVAASGYLAGAVASGHVLLARLLLVEPASRFEEQVGQLIRARARLVHGFDAERRRIERDLHDVAQQRVVTLTMHLGLAELDLAGELGTEHPITREVATAREHATELMAELRALIHGIHPQVLTDLGVGAAVDQLAATMPLPVEVRDELGERPARHVESTLYSCLNEALTNAARHSGAHRVTVTLRRLDGTVLAEVRDDGRGGADPARGSGLVGLADRAAVLDGTVTVSSPPGGPTLLRIALPDDRSQEP